MLYCADFLGGVGVSFVRAIGRWSMTGLVVGNVIGAGIFGVTGELTRLLGRPSPLGMVVVALGMAVIMAAIAEVASQFSEAGGAYLYVRTKFRTPRRIVGRLVLAAFPHCCRGRVRKSLRVLCRPIYASFGA